VGLDLVGDTSITGEPEFLEHCKKMCDGAQIKMVGPATRGECVWWFSQAKCLLHPNQRFREPFGLAPVEAMACGCPVIAWDYGAMRETIDVKSTGWLVKSFDELVWVVNDVSRSRVGIEEMRPRCREWASQFSIQKMVQNYETLCQEAIEGGGW
jgi:glycosyltransferase involved in cell wall biosynthesis